MAFFNGVAWDTFITDIQTQYLGPGNAREIITFQLYRLHRVLQRKSALFWHSTYLGKYIDNSIVPFGLRIQIFPNIPTVRDTLKSRWEENLTKCSCEKMTILQEHYEQEIQNIDKKILEIQSKLTPFSDLDLYQINLTFLKNNI